MTGAELARASRLVQGFTEHVDDQVVLERVAATIVAAAAPSKAA